jgi:predicted Zn-dependent peptidase
MNKTIKKVIYNNKTFSVVELPDTNFFKFEIINWKGSSIERVFQKITGKNVYGISHLIEHLSFKSTKDFTSEELNETLKKYGSYNASTSYDRINYFYETTMDKVDTAVNIVCNVAFNDLTKISKEEYEMERNVVSNEAKRYKDDSQTSFYLQLASQQFGYDKDDNIIGSVSIIDSLNIEDCISIKNLFLNEKDHTYVIVYDPKIMDLDTLLSKIDKEINRFTLLKEMKKEYEEEYYSSLGKHRIGEFIENTETDQIMSAIIFDRFDDIYVTQYTSKYLSSMAPGISMNDYIREKNGLTYGISFGVEQNNYTQKLTFACDVSPGTENKMFDLFVQSVNECADTFSIENHKMFIDSLKLKTAMRLLNQKEYIRFAKEMFEHKDWDRISEWFEEDANSAIYKLIEDVTFEKMKSNMNMFKELVNKKQYCYVKGLKVSTTTT